MDEESENEQVDNDVKIEMTEKQMKRGGYVTVADGDGQQYVVLEVIQLEDGTEQQVAVVAPDYVEEEQHNNFIHIHNTTSLGKFDILLRF